MRVGSFLGALGSRRESDLNLSRIYLGKRRDTGLSCIGMEIQFMADLDGGKSVLSGVIVSLGSPRAS